MTGLAVASALTTQAALAETTTLRVAHVWPGGSMIDKELFQAWATSVEEASQGRLEVEVYPGQTLTKSDKTYESIANGIADIAPPLRLYRRTLPPDAGHRVARRLGQQPPGSCILQSLYDAGHLNAEYADTHSLFMFTTGPGYLHTKTQPIETPEDLDGLRLRRPTPLVGDMFERLGAQAVGMPAPDVFTAMQRGVVDGLSFNWEGMKTFRLNELANHHTEVPLYDLSLFATMNQRTYDALPDDLQQVIDDHSGLSGHCAPPRSTTS